MTEPIHRPSPGFLVTLGLVAAAFAIGPGRLWQVLPWQRFGWSLLIGSAALMSAWLLQRIMRWSIASGLVAVWLLALAWFVGPPALIATCLLAAAALGVGLRLTPSVPGHGAIALVVGLMVIAGVTGWLILLPIHQALAWWALLIVIVFVQRATLLDCLGNVQIGWRREVAAAPAWAALVILLLGLASTACWLPTMQADDLAYHLGLPSQLLEYRRYAPLPQHQVWSYAPWASDVLQGIVAVLSRAQGRGAVDALWLAATAAAVWAATGRLSNSSNERWACVALFASFPPLVWLAAGMQTELPAMAVLITLAATLLPVTAGRRLQDDPPHVLHVAAILTGGLFALKLIHVLAGLPLLAYAGWRHRHHWPWRRLLIALVIVSAIGGASYWYSWRITGNPLLPLFNATFASPYFVLRDFDDLRWHAGLGLALPWHLVVDTHRYSEEAWDGGLGINLIALAGAWVLALWRADTRSFAIAATLTILLPLVPLQYARYAFPGMALWLIVVVPGLEAVLGKRWFAPTIIGICLVNLAFQANAGWTQHSSALKHLLRSGGDNAAVLVDYAPERVLIAKLPDDGSIVLATDPARGFIAELAGRGRTMSWHDPALETARNAAEADTSGERWRALFASTHAHWILMTPAKTSPALGNALRNAAAMRTAQAGAAELWQLPYGAQHP
jgi:hypothetical protein